MISGLGILGYGVGGIEAEAVLLGQPLYQPLPRVVGVRLHGALPTGSTATDLVLVVSQLLRAHGVVGKFVEFTGDGLASLALADRATLANMAPEYGATTGIFPIDEETLAYLRLTGRDEARIALVEAYAREQGLWRLPGATPLFDETLELDLAIGAARPWPARAGPRTAWPWATCATASARTFRRLVGTASGYPAVAVRAQDQEASLATGSVAIAAITSCTNTSNPSVMVGAGLLARNAVARGLSVGPTVKTSLAPGSRAVTAYLRDAGLLPPLEAARLRRGRLRLHHLHRQQRAAGRRRRGGRRGQRPGGGRGPLGQPQLRGPHPSARQGLLPGLAAPGRGLRAGRPRGHRPGERAARRRQRRDARSCWPTSGPRPRRSPTPSRAPSPRSSSGPRTPASSRATSAGGPCPCPPATATRGTRSRRTSPRRRSSAA